MQLKKVMFSLGNKFTSLDVYKSNTAAAYSVSKLFSSSTKSFKVRRASDNTTLDIGFINNKLDTISLSSFISGSSGFVTTWYDQSGNGFDLLQSDITKQPIVHLNISNGLPSISFDGINDIMVNVANVFNSSFNKSFSNIVLSKKTPGSNFGIATQTPGFHYGRFQDTGLQRFGTTGIATGGNNIGLHALYDNVNNLFTTTFTYDGTNRKIYVNNVLYTTVLSNGPSDNMNLSSNITVGSAFDASSPWNGDIYTCIYLNKALSASDTTAIGNKLKNDFGLGLPPFIMFDGNSRTLGFGSSTGSNAYPGFSYPSQLVASLGGYPALYNFKNQASNGSSSEALISSFTTSNIFNTNGYCAKNIVIFSEIIDSLITGDTAAQAVAAQDTYLSQYKSLGYIVIALTCAAGQLNISNPNATNANGVSTNSMETQRLLANSQILANASNLYDYVIDVGADSRVGTLSSTNNMTYWNTDKLHNNDTGYGVLAGLIKPTLTYLLNV